MEHDFVVISSHDTVYDNYNNDLFITTTDSSFSIKIGDTLLFGNAEIGTVVDNDGRSYLIKKANKDA